MSQWYLINKDRGNLELHGGADRTEAYWNFKAILKFQKIRNQSDLIHLVTALYRLIVI